MSFSDASYEKVFLKGRGIFKLYLVLTSIQVIMYTLATAILASTFPLAIHYYHYGTFNLLATLGILMIAFLIPFTMYQGFDLKYALDYWRMKTQ
jgi:hypothetical protein